jgi:bifunctional UDP-N-acetylglucosamine pyrophosphorylase/glucosamine-1-phosphate N-acetyltransferase
MPLSVVILAAGQGKRMNSDLPKVLQPLAGSPLLQHVIRTARALNPANIAVVYGHGGAQVQAAFDHEDVDWVLQADQLGTGHAVMQAMLTIPDDHTVLVLYGDVPLIGTASLQKLTGLANGGVLAILSVNLDEAAGYGRIVRDAQGHVSAIVEHKDASPQQLQIREANSGLLAAPAGRLRECSPRILRKSWASTTASSSPRSRLATARCVPAISCWQALRSPIRSASTCAATSPWSATCISTSTPF